MDRMYTIDKDAGIVRWTGQTVANVDSILDGVANKIGTLVPDCFEVRGQPVTVFAKKAYTLLLTRLPKLHLRTTFQIDAGDFVPAFRPITHRDRPIARECVWTPPATMLLHFVLSLEEGRPLQPLLFATHADPGDGQEGFWRLPLANVYTDGRLCLGEMFERLRPLGTMAAMLEATLAILDRSDWNTDLIPEVMDKTCKLFRFDPVTGLSKTVAGFWTDCCHRTSNPLMGEVIP